MNKAGKPLLVNLYLIFPRAPSCMIPISPKVLRLDDHGGILLYQILNDTYLMIFN
jgi:hypothetical protein